MCLIKVVEKLYHHVTGVPKYFTSKVLGAQCQRGCIAFGFHLPVLNTSLLHTNSSNAEVWKGKLYFEPLLHGRVAIRWHAL